MNIIRRFTCCSYPYGPHEHPLDVPTDHEPEHAELHAQCPRCHKWQYPETIRFVRACFWCGSETVTLEDISRLENDDPVNIYRCDRCGAVEGDPAMRTKPQG